MGNHVGNAETQAIPLENCGGSVRSSSRLPAQLRVASPVAEELEANKWAS